MRKFFISLGMTISAAMGIANADSANSTKSFVSMCVAEVGAQMNYPEMGCACGAGVLGGLMDERQYGIVGRTVPYFDNQQAMIAEIQRMMSEGYSVEEIQSVAIQLQNSGSRIDRVCGVLEQPFNAVQVSQTNGVTAKRTKVGEWASSAGFALNPIMSGHE